MVDFLEKRRELGLLLGSGVLAAGAVSYLSTVVYERINDRGFILAIVLVALFGFGVFYIGLHPYTQERLRIRGLMVFRRLGASRFSTHFLSLGGYRTPFGSVLDTMFSQAWDKAENAGREFFDEKDVKDILEVALLYSLLQASFSGIKNYLGEKTKPIDFSQIQAKFKDNNYLNMIQSNLYSCLPSDVSLDRMKRGLIRLRGSLMMIEAKIIPTTTQWPWLVLFDPDSLLQSEWLFSKVIGRDVPRKFIPLTFEIEVKCDMRIRGFLTRPKIIKGYLDWVQNIFRTLECDFDLENFLEGFEKAERAKRWLLGFREEQGVLEELSQSLKGFLKRCERTKDTDTENET